MHPLSLSYAPVDALATGLATAVAWSGGGYALAAKTTPDSLSHIITIGGKAATNHSGKTFTITGTDPDGRPQSEAIAGPNGVATVASTLYFRTVTSITVSATTGADTFDIGYTAAAVSPTIPVDWRANQFQVAVAVVITGTINVTVQHTFDGLHDEYVSSPTWFPNSGITSKTASTDGNYAYPITATRLLVNSVTAGATVAFKIVQNPQ